MNDTARDVLAEGAMWAAEAAECRAGMAAMPPGCVHAVCTSPPYWNQRDYEHPDQIGNEPTVQGYVDSMVDVGRSIRHVLRDDGVWWLNIGDTYSRAPSRGARGRNADRPDSLTASNDRASSNRQEPRPEGDLLLVPYRVAMGLQADGWILRQVVQWCKRSPMPGAPAGKCTQATEPVFMLTKSTDYFYDYLGDPRPLTHATQEELTKLHGRTGEGGNLFSYWELDWWNDIATENNSAKHFAPYPLALARRCLRLSTSAYGVCPECGKPWERQIAKKRMPTRPGRTSKVDSLSSKLDDHADPTRIKRDVLKTGNRDRGRHVTIAETEGWQAACTCNNPLTVPPLVLDPFVGSGTTIRAALGLGLRAIGFEINPTYAATCREYIRQKLSGTPTRKATTKGK